MTNTLVFNSVLLNSVRLGFGLTYPELGASLISNSPVVLRGDYVS